MSTWISERAGWRGTLFAALLGPLAGCLAVEPAPQAPLRAVALGDGALTVTAPRGYCVDRSSLRGPSGRVVLLASCERLTGMPGVAVEPAVMTVSILPQAEDAPAPTPEGLARAVAPARVGQSGVMGDLAYAQVIRGDTAPLPGGDPRHWRGARVVAGHLVGLALYAPEGSALGGAEGRALLLALSEGVRAEQGPGQGPIKGPIQSPIPGLFPVSN